MYSLPSLFPCSSGFGYLVDVFWSGYLFLKLVFFFCGLFRRLYGHVETVLTPKQAHSTAQQAQMA